MVVDAAKGRVGKAANGKEPPKPAPAYYMLLPLSLPADAVLTPVSSVFWLFVVSTGIAPPLLIRTNAHQTKTRFPEVIFFKISANFSLQTGVSRHSFSTLVKQLSKRVVPQTKFPTNTML
jgi:hypothetical protein